MWALCCNAGHPVMENIVYQLFLVLCRPTNRSNFYYSQARRQDFAAGRPRFTRGDTFLKYNIECMQQPPRKNSLATCKLYSHLPRPRRLYRYECRAGRGPSFALLKLGQGKRQEIAYFANRYFYLLVGEQDFSVWPFLSRDISVRLWNLAEILH